MTEIRPVPYGSQEYDATVELRRAVLRRPLGLDFTEEQLAAEKDDVHFAFLHADEALACLVFTPKGDGVLKMRQVAVREDLQGQGLGRQLVETSEAWARANGYKRIVLHARDTAVPFYLAQGYAIEGEPFEEVGIPHRAMFKTISTPLPSGGEGQG
jgi:predicted GNAT family N-acyltransferase